MIDIIFIRITITLYMISSILIYLLLISEIIYKNIYIYIINDRDAFIFTYLYHIY